ncbi:UNVERIFIED_CONTAM: hypothetical protein HDU68_012108 [Siphonaria sp. JEL0065]|nr:hypothetical protein HDU68_012108 [Siphonaria sp. JEL0065]
MQPIFESCRNYNLAGASDPPIRCPPKSLGNAESSVPNATLIATGVIGASKDHPFINLIIDNIDLHGGAVGHGAGWAIVGPQLLTDVFPMYLKQQAKTEGGGGHSEEVPIPAGSDKYIRLNSYCVSWWGSTFDTYGKDWQEVA